MNEKEFAEWVHKNWPSSTLEDHVLGMLEALRSERERVRELEEGLRNVMASAQLFNRETDEVWFAIKNQTAKLLTPSEPHE